MNTMYREIVERKTISVAIGIILGVIFMIATCSVLENLQVVARSARGVQELIFLLVTLGMIAFEVTRSRVKYKYSIVADQIIICKVKNGHEDIVENVKFKDVVFIGKGRNLKDTYKIVSSKKYACYFLNKTKYCCIYKDGQAYKRFYFEPSEVLITKLNSMIKNNL